MGEMIKAVQRMKPVPNWRRVLMYAWSIRLVALVAILNGCETALNLAGGSLPVDPTILFATSFVVTVAAMVARIVYQKKLKED